LFEPQHTQGHLDQTPITVTQPAFLCCFRAVHSASPKQSTCHRLLKAWFCLVLPQKARFLSPVLTLAPPLLPFSPGNFDHLIGHFFPATDAPTDSQGLSGQVHRDDRAFAGGEKAIPAEGAKKAFGNRGSSYST
jgi:hypothetical protein